MKELEARRTEGAEHSETALTGSSLPERTPEIEALEAEMARQPAGCRGLAPSSRLELTACAEPGTLLRDSCSTLAAIGGTIAER
jgi:hypothetical protein